MPRSRIEPSRRQRDRAADRAVYTHFLRYEQPDGTFSDGFLAFTHDEAKGTAEARRLRTGRKVTVARLSA